MSTGRLGAGDTAIQPTIFDAKGDLLTATAGDTPARIAVGNSGETLVADSSATTGLRWNPSPTLANPVINGGFDIWQRATSAALGAGGVVTSADRWATYTGGGAGTMSRQTTGDTTNLAFIQYCARIQRTAGSTATNNFQVGNSFETVNSIPFSGRTVTLSFYARAGANYSATSNAFVANLRTGTGTDQNYILSGYTGSSGFSTTATLTTTWQRFTVTGTVGSTVTEIAVEFVWTPTGTAGANDYAEVTGVQLDLGSVALPFRRTGGTIAGELQAAQRYYTLIASGNSKAIGMGSYGSATAIDSIIALPVEMRTTPTISIVTGTGFYNASSAGGGNDALNSLTLASESTTRNVFFFNNTEAAGTAGQACRLTTANASAFLAVQAEL